MCTSEDTPTKKILCGFFEQFWPLLCYVFCCMRTGAGLHSEPKRVLCKIHAAIYTIARRALRERMQQKPVGRFTKCLNPCQRIQRFKLFQNYRVLSLEHLVLPLSCTRELCAMDETNFNVQDFQIHVLPIPQTLK